MPAPLGPITASSSPGLAVKLTSRRAARSPKRFVRPRASITAAPVASCPLTAERYATADTVGAMKVLFVADVVGKPGRAGLGRAMPGLRDRYAPDLVIVNGENSAGGIGITEKTAADLFSIGAGVITLGNHAFRHRDVYDYLDRDERVIRPANLMASNPGRGYTVVEATARGSRSST